MTIFDAATIELQGLNLIEASAGTGKTYTLAELFLRLILEKNLKVSQILVVTYTRAATEELRDRLRKKLVSARDELVKQPSEREMLMDLVDPDETKIATYKLLEAIQSFDEAAIFTIHGFCQRVLTDFAFESGRRFELELIGDDLALLQSATDDFWRREVTNANKDFVAYLLAKKETPETLLSAVGNLVGKPYMQCLPVVDVDIELYTEQTQKLFDLVKKTWWQEQQQIIETLKNKTLLNGNKYRSTSVEQWLLLLTDLMNQSHIPINLFDGFERFTTGKLEDALKSGQILPALNFWSDCEQLLEQHLQLQQAYALKLQNLRVQLLNYLRDALPQQKLQLQVQSYDDLLVDLELALNGAHGDWLVTKLREQYQAALIDEFQDTDPVQYASFSRIYSESGLPTFLVGDPKQAIYSFRGADIFTYLKAKKKADNEYTLAKNWRSHHKLVSAINTLFSRQKQPFIFKAIPFYPVDSARQDSPALIVADTEHAPLQLLWKSHDKPMAKQEFRTISTNVTADEIAKLMNQAQAGQAKLFDTKLNQYRPLSGGDIAVLVRNHRQANLIQQSLQLRGINSVQQGRDNVFSSPEALLLQRVLIAVAEPSSEQRVTAALTTFLWGMTASDIYQLKQDEQHWLAQVDVFYELHQVWLQHGFIRFFRQLMLKTSALQRILAFPNGERQITNLNHLTELIQSQCQHQEGMEKVLHWLSMHIQSAQSNDEEAQLRLESDEQLVKIITIHKSKGLEYPIVFCPFLWDANLRSGKNTVLTFHEQGKDQTCAAFSDPALSEAKEKVLIEEQAEDLRLLYVALTRARERCVIVWGNAKDSSISALFGLLHPSLSTADNDTMQLDLETLSVANEGVISLQNINDSDSVYVLATDQQRERLNARVFKGRIQPPWRIGSFSALTKGHNAELPDYDGQLVQENIADSIQTPIKIHTELDRFSFPRGAQAGTCLHALFEQWDFACQDQESLRTLVSRTLLQYGFDEKWTSVACQWLNEVLATPLDNSKLTLAKLKQTQCLDELSFYFPVAGLSVARLQKACLPLLKGNSPLKTVIENLHFSSLTGFMKGFIDLVFEYQGRFYIVDYKSNYLGADPIDYQGTLLDNAMIDHDYPLQYLIYSLALHRYLALRLPDYDPDIHLGGVYYLFIRGMKIDWQQAGIFFDKPASQLLEALDHCMKGADDE